MKKRAQEQSTKASTRLRVLAPQALDEVRGSGVATSPGQPIAQPTPTQTT